MAEVPNPVTICELAHGSIEEETACEALRLAGIPDCSNCGRFRIESHPQIKVVRCANCKEWLAW